ncbi:MAG: DUF962 domain-containing protein [Candidatus Sericytochromatia bacterium]
MIEEEKKYETLEDFWPFYLSQHQNPVNRNLHFLGSSIGLFCIGKAISKKKPSYLLLGLVAGYGCAWAGHFLIEKNRPATFKYPLKSFISDWLMFGTRLTGKLDNELIKEDVLKLVSEKIKN